MALTTLANVKTYLSISGSDDDTLISSLIVRAQAMIETFCNRDSFDSASYTEYHDPKGSGRVILKNTPVTAVAAVNTRASATTWSAVSSSLYDWTTNGVIAIVSVSAWSQGYSIEYPADQRLGIGLKSVEVEYTGGYSSIPADLEQGCIDLVAMLYGGGAEARLSRARGIASESLGYTSWTYMTHDDRQSFMRENFGAYRRPFA